MAPEITAGEDDEAARGRPKSRFPGASPCAMGRRLRLSPLNEGGQGALSPQERWSNNKARSPGVSRSKPEAHCVRNAG